MRLWRQSGGEDEAVNDKEQDEMAQAEGHARCMNSNGRAGRKRRKGGDGEVMR